VFSPTTCRAARALLEWSQTDLAAHAGISRFTVINFEKGVRGTGPDSETAMQRAFTSAGIEFQNGGSPGVRLRPTGRKRKASR
jgi:DNA-binding XRE family transcriptional regulator